MEWISFDEIKKTVSLQMVIEHYGLKLKQVAPATLRGKCPLPTHGSAKSNASFTATLTKGVGGAWACQSKSCIEASGRRGGNALDLVAAIERCSIREAALKLQQWFAVPSGGDSPQVKSVPASAARTDGKQIEPQLPVSKEITGDTEGPNKPLAFTLRGIHAAHPYIGSRGITRETADLFGIGYFPGKGTMAGRIVIPIHNGEGELVAYAGRSIDDAEPRYRFPAGFHKSLELFNLHRAIAQSNRRHRVVVVEGFFDCLNVSAAGFPCVALMGSSMSEAQEALIVRHFSVACILLDGDKAGQEGAMDCLARLGRRMWTYAPALPEGKQPDMLSTEEIQSLLKK